MRAVSAVVVATALHGMPALAHDLVEAAERHRLPVSLVRAVVAVESAGDARAVSSKGAMGLMQLMPATAARFGVADPLDPSQSLEGGCAYLRWLIDRFDGNLALALAGYNAGEGAVDRYAGIPPFAETRAYVRRVLELLQEPEEALRPRSIARAARSSALPSSTPASSLVTYAAASGGLSSIVGGSR